MAARTDSACKFICKAGDWRVTNLQLQKILYFSQMCYLGLEHDRLADTAFEAWDYGPVSPKVYRQVRMFGSSPIRDVFSRRDHSLTRANGERYFRTHVGICFRCVRAS